MKKAIIIGFGRFGELLARLYSASFEISIVESNPERASAAKNAGYGVVDFDDIQNADFVFLAVPISEMKSILSKLARLVNRNTVVVDHCSVKVYPVGLMKKHLVDAQIIGTHPMFGPDSAKKGLAGMQVAVCPINIEPDNLKILEDFWRRQGVVVVETTPEVHDKDAVFSQAFTYSLAKIILHMDMPDVKFRTKSFDNLMEVARLSANDTEQLFHDMLFFNPYFSEMKASLESAMVKTAKTLDEIEGDQTRARQA